MTAAFQYISQHRPGWDHSDVVRCACQAGVECVQLRMKNDSRAKIIEEGKVVKELCLEYNAKFILNDDPELAVLLGADGIHLGLKDMPIGEARRLVGDSMLIGGTANTLDDILKHRDEGADYIGLGPFRFTNTKKNLSPILEYDGIMAVMEALDVLGIDIPVVAIGGIRIEDIKRLKKTGVSGIAISGDFTDAILNDRASLVFAEIMGIWNEKIHLDQDKTF